MDEILNLIESVSEDFPSYSFISKSKICISADGLIVLLRARRNEKELKVKPASSFKYFQYLLTKKLKQSSRQRKYNLTVP